MGSCLLSEDSYWMLEAGFGPGVSYAGEQGGNLDIHTRSLEVTNHCIYIVTGLILDVFLCYLGIYTLFMLHQYLSGLEAH